MRLFIFCFMVLMSGVNSFAQDSTNCNFKTGDFYVLNGTDTCFIKRTEDRQIERCNGSDDEHQLIVVWLKDKKYILRDIHYNPSTTARVMRNDVVMDILEVGSDYHMVQMKAQGKGKRVLKVYCQQK